MNFKKLFENWQRYLDEAEKFAFENDSVEKQIQEIEKLKEDIQAGSIIYFDTETTGISAKTDQIVQLAYSIMGGPEPKDENIVAFLTPESMNRFNYGQYDSANKQYPELEKDPVNPRETPEFKATKDKMIASKNKSLETIELKNQNGEYTPEEYQTKKKRVEDEIRSVNPREVLSMNHYLEKEPQVSEKDMLSRFIKDVSKLASNKSSKVILCAHNIDFDARMINERCSVYGLNSPLISIKRKKGELPNPEDNVILLDSLMVAKNVYKESLEQLLAKYESDLQQTSAPSQEQTLINALSQLKPDLANSFEKLNIKDLKQQLLDIAKEEGYSEQDFKKLLTHLMRIGTTNALQTNLEDRTKFSAKLGDIAKTIKINPENAHDALVDVKMMIKIFDYMLQTLNHVKKVVFKK
jgi:DNA polymerase III alpha subunit (gram-positive type)